MDLSSFFQSAQKASGADLSALVEAGWSGKHLSKGTELVSQSAENRSEYLLLDGLASSKISDPDGRSVCVAFHASPSVINPHVARTKNNLSLVSIEAHTDLLVAEISAEDLTKLMVKFAPVREWANAILQRELVKKTEREWCLAALPARERLLWFRENYKDHEEMFPHTLIAPFLGMTPVTLSRMRARN